MMQFVPTAYIRWASVALILSIAVPPTLYFFVMHLVGSGAIGNGPHDPAANILASGALVAGCATLMAALVTVAVAILQFGIAVGQETRKRTVDTPTQFDFDT